MIRKIVTVKQMTSTDVQLYIGAKPNLYPLGFRMNTSFWSNSLNLISPWLHNTLVKFGTGFHRSNRTLKLPIKWFRFKAINIPVSAIIISKSYKNYPKISILSKLHHNGASLPAVKYGFNKFGFSNLGFNKPTFTMLFFKNLAFNNPWIQQPCG